MRIKHFIPSEFQNSIFVINYQALKDQGFKALFFDLDNTIIDYDQPHFTPEVTELLTKLQKDFCVVVISNSGKKRVAKACQDIVPFVCRALKPLKSGFKKALKLAKVTPSEAVMIGDQILTDIKGSGKLGIRNILVTPIAESTEKLVTKINRLRETRVLKQIDKHYPKAFEEIILPYVKSSK